MSWVWTVCRLCSPDKAFDFVDRFALWQILIKIGCPTDFVNIIRIRSFHQSMRALKWRIHRISSMLRAESTLRVQTSPAVALIIHRTVCPMVGVALRVAIVAIIATHCLHCILMSCAISWLTRELACTRVMAQKLLDPDGLQNLINYSMSRGQLAT